MSDFNESQFEMDTQPYMEDDSWLEVAKEDNQTAEKLSQEISELDGLASDTDSNDGLTDVGPTTNISALDRVAKFQKQKLAQEDPFWLEDFWPITEAMEDTISEDGKRSLQEPMNIVSGCTGLFAEGWVCKVRWGIVSLISWVYILKIS